MVFKRICVISAAALLAGPLSISHARSATLDLSGGRYEVVDVKTPLNGFVQLGPYVRTSGPDCGTVGKARAYITKPPNFGTVKVITVTGSRGLQPNRRLSACDRQPATGTAVKYIARRDYAGADKFEFRVIFPDGEARDFTVNVAVQ